MYVELVAKRTADDLQQVRCALTRSQQSLDELVLSRHRRERAVPRLESLMKWFETQKQELLAKSPLAQVASYPLNHRAALMSQVEDGSLSINNNLSKRTLRRVTIDLKDWLFDGNDQGGRTAAALMSLIASCNLLEVDPYRQLRDLFIALPTLGESPSSEAIGAWLPDAYLLAHPNRPRQKNEPAMHLGKRFPPASISG